MYNKCIRLTLVNEVIILKDIGTHQKVCLEVFKIKLKIVGIGIAICIILQMVYYSNYVVSFYFKATGVILLIYFILLMYIYKREMSSLQQVEDETLWAFDKVEVLEKRIQKLEKEIDTIKKKI